MFSRQLLGLKVIHLSLPTARELIAQFLEVWCAILCFLDLGKYEQFSVQCRKFRFKPSNEKKLSWTKRISNSIKNSFLGTPRFHRRKASRDGSVPSLDEGFMNSSPSTDSEKRSWFKDVWNSVGNSDGVYTLFINEEHQQRVKIRLVQVKVKLPNIYLYELVFDFKP